MPKGSSPADKPPLQSPLVVADPVLQGVNDPLLVDREVTLDVLRLDQIHPLVHGNKWYKLKLNLAAAAGGGHDAMLSFGGAYSNHLLALAAACHLHGMRSIGVVRGEIVEPLNPVLNRARALGMHLYGVDRKQYRVKHLPAMEQQLRERFGNFYLVPEGGSNELGVAGCEEIIRSLRSQLGGLERATDTRLAVACGTGATLAGLVRGVSRHGLALHSIGISVLKAGDSHARQVARWVAADQGDWSLETGFHFGGYARTTPELLQFCRRFGAVSGIPLEPVYTGKLAWAIYDMVRAGRFPPGSRIIMLHTGGILPVAQSD